MEKLKSRDGAFRELHYEVIDRIDEGDKDTIEAEQVILDKHDDDVAALTFHLESLLVATASVPDIRKSLTQKLSRLQVGLRRIDDLTEEASVEHSVLMQCQEEVADFKRDLAALYDELITHEIDEGDDLFASHSSTEIELSRLATKIKRSLAGTPGMTTMMTGSSDTYGVRLPKLEVQTFDGNIIQWKQFWEKFSKSLHDRASPSNVERIVYLQHVLKDGSAKNAIEGLSHSGENYVEAVKCIRA